VFERVSVKRGPFFSGYPGLDRDCMIYDQVASARRRFQIRVVLKPVPHEKERQFGLMGLAQKSLKYFRAALIEPVLMRVQVRRVNAHHVRTFDLCSQFQLHLLRIYTILWSPIQVKIAIFVD